MKNSTFISFDNTEIYYSFWDKVVEPKGVIQIIHGMAEHGGRYNDFALYLNSLGFIVYATDHREHGRSIKKAQNNNYIKDNDIFYMVKDEEIFTILIRKKYKDLPFFLMGHSLGSFILQKYLQQVGTVSLFNENKAPINGAVIMGSAFASWEYHLGRGLSWSFLKLFGNRKLRIAEKIVFRNFHISFVPKYIHSLRSNKKSNSIKKQSSFIKYKESHELDMIFSLKFYYELFTFMIDVFKAYNMELIDTNIPLLIVSGKNDVIGGKSKKIQKLYSEYQKLGCKDVTKKLYDNSLHDIIHKKDKDIVYEDIKEWIIERC